jgi:acetylglutamate kinase
MLLKKYSVMDDLIILKIGGKIINNKSSLNDLLNKFSKINENKILVHGGGNKATEISEKLNVKVNIVHGRRVTDEESLEIATMIYAGSINKYIVSKLQALNCNSIGLSGPDGNSIKSIKRIVKSIDFGYVGDVSFVNSKFIISLINNNLNPVFSAITHDGNGQLLNTNADSIASAISIELSKFYKVKLLYCFEKKGVLENINDDKSIIDIIDLTNYNRLVKNEKISEGMIPKLENCFEALKNGVSQVKIGNNEMLGEGSFFTEIKL